MREYSFKNVGSCCYPPSLFFTTTFFSSKLHVVTIERLDFVDRLAETARGGPEEGAGEAGLVHHWRQSRPCTEDL